MSILISCMITPAQATVGDVYAWVKSTFYEFVHDVGIATDGSDGFLTDLFEPADGECNHIWTYNTDDYKYCERCELGFEEYYNTKYNQYVSDLQTDLGSDILIGGASRGGGIRIYAEASQVRYTSSTFSSYELGTHPRGVVSSTHDYGWRAGFDFNSVEIPFDGTVTTGHSVSWTPLSNAIDDTSDQTKGTIKYEGNSYSPGYVQIRWSADYDSVFYSIECQRWVDIVPATSTLPTTQNISINSRPSSITGDYGILGDDGTIIKVDKTIVDEGHSIVYNPVTNTTYNYTDYAYDYSDRSYNLTLEDGSTMKVVYGDENVTIEEGDTVYNVYYLTSGSEGGSGSGGSGDNGSGGIGGAIGGLFDVLGEIIYGLIEGTINLATKALSALTGLLDLLKQFGESVIIFFGGYTDFLGAVFPFLPEETFTILNLGLILMIAAAVFKKFL